MRDVLELPFVDSGDGWLIFGLLPAEVAFHPSKKKSVEEFYLLCDDIDDQVQQSSATTLGISDQVETPGRRATQDLSAVTCTTETHEARHVQSEKRCEAESGKTTKGIDICSES
jgi:hypothetical protein